MADAGPLGRICETLPCSVHLTANIVGIAIQTCVSSGLSLNQIRFMHRCVHLRAQMMRANGACPRLQGGQNGLSFLVTDFDQEDVP